MFELFIIKIVPYFFYLDICASMNLMNIAIRYVALFLLFVIPALLHAQEKKIYVDDDLNIAAKRSAKHYLILTTDTNRYRVEEYSNRGDQLEMSGYCQLSEDMPLLEGNVIYYVNGFKTSEGCYHNNHKNGNWVEYFDSTTSVSSKDYYTDGLIDGLHTEYYPSGYRSVVGRFKHNNRIGEWKDYFDSSDKISSVYQYIDDSLSGPQTDYYRSGSTSLAGYNAGNKKIGKWTGYYDSGSLVHYVMIYNDVATGYRLSSYYKNGKVKSNESYMSDTVVAGNRFDSTGREVAFFPFFLQAKPSYSLLAYLVHSIKYPTKALEQGITGRVVVAFVVDITGRITHVKIKRHVGGGCDEEAARVITNMPTWKPGRVDGEKVSMQYTQPISFTLQ